MASTKTYHKEAKNNVIKGPPKATSNGKDLPDFKEIIGYIYSSYMGDELISGVESLQEKYPSLRPFIYSSSVMSIIPLVIFAQSVLFIFSANVFVGTFAIYCYRKACILPLVENMGNYCYNRVHSVLLSKEEIVEKNCQENQDEIKSLKRIFTKVYDIMNDVRNTLKLAFDKSFDSTGRDQNSKRVFPSAIIYGFFEPLSLMLKGKSPERVSENKYNGIRKKNYEYVSPEKSSEKPAENENDEKKSDYASSGTPSNSPFPEGLPPNEFPPLSESNNKAHRTASNFYEKEEPHFEEKESYADVLKENTENNEEKEIYADIVKENLVDNEDGEKASYADIVKEICASNEDKTLINNEFGKKELETGATDSFDNNKDNVVKAPGLFQGDVETPGTVDEHQATN